MSAIARLVIVESGAQGGEHRYGFFYGRPFLGRLLRRGRVRVGYAGQPRRELVPLHRVLCVECDRHPASTVHRLWRGRAWRYGVPICRPCLSRWIVLSIALLGPRR